MERRRAAAHRHDHRLLCLEDGRRARQLARSAFKWFYEELFRVTLPVLEKLYPATSRFTNLGASAADEARHYLRPARYLRHAVAGDPDTCIAKLRKYQAAGVTNLLCAIGAGALDTDVTRESMRCIAQHVMPAFKL